MQPTPFPVVVLCLLLFGAMGASFLCCIITSIAERKIFQPNFWLFSQSKNTFSEKDDAFLFWLILCCHGLTCFFIFFAAATLVLCDKERGGSILQIAFLLLPLFFGLIIGLYAGVALWRGFVCIPGSYFSKTKQIYRKDQPLSFWITILRIVVASGFLIFVFARMLDKLP